MAWHHRDLIIATHRQLGAPVSSVRSRHSRIRPCVPCPGMSTTRNHDFVPSVMLSALFPLSPELAALLICDYIIFDITAAPERIAHTMNRYESLRTYHWPLPTTRSPGFPLSAWRHPLKGVPRTALRPAAPAPTRGGGADRRLRGLPLRPSVPTCADSAEQVMSRVPPREITNRVGHRYTTRVPVSA